jgi:hypothetical protein
VKNSAKHFLCISTALLLMLGACKKNNIVPPLSPRTIHNDSVNRRLDFRDSIIGKYFCLLHHVTTPQPMGAGIDSVIGMDTLFVFKVNSDTNSILISNGIGEFSDMLHHDSVSVSYLDTVYYNQLNFSLQNNSWSLNYVFESWPKWIAS